MSLRSGGRINVQEVAARLGGGGHARAAGLTFKGTLDEAISSLHEVLLAEGL